MFAQDRINVVRHGKYDLFGVILCLLVQMYVEHFLVIRKRNILLFNKD